MLVLRKQRSFPFAITWHFNGHQFILDWFERAHRDGYPGLSAIPGAIRLDQVDDLRLQ